MTGFMRSQRARPPALSMALWVCAIGLSACNAPRPAASSSGGDTPPAKATPATGATPPANATPPAQETSQERVQRLEREARALARADGCTSAGECRAAPVGDRPCGGPRTYVVYCARTTDSAALYRKLDELAKAERAYNQGRGAFSTCEFRTPPHVEAAGGSCRAAQ
jgi:hypothetical protein